jgi:hypothetical protein
MRRAGWVAEQDAMALRPAAVKVHGDRRMVGVPGERREPCRRHDLVGEIGVER